MNLPHFKSYNSILVVVDHLTLMIHFILYNKTRINEKITKLFFYHILQYHGLLKISFLTMDLASKFWKKFFELLDVKVKLLLIFHL
jgi:hypothetical protein